MNRTEINRRWIVYKAREGINSNLQIDDVIMDAPEGVEASFDMQELLEGKRILHVTFKMEGYHGEYVDFLLCHEFTHLADHIICPYTDESQCYLYMNAYSEFHASRLSLLRLLEKKRETSGILRQNGSVESLSLSLIGIDLIPQPYKEGSVRQLMNSIYLKTKTFFEKFRALSVPQLFQYCFKHMMYMFGYLSLFQGAEEMITRVCEDLHLRAGDYLSLYRALLAGDLNGALEKARAIYDEAFLPFVKAFADDPQGAASKEGSGDYWEIIGGETGNWNWGGRSRANVGVQQKFKGYRRGRGNKPVESVEELKRELGL